MTMFKKKRIVIFTATLILIPILIYFMLDPTGSTERIMVPVRKGEFVISVVTTGELEAKNSIKIMGPAGLRSARIWQVKLDDIIPEGTVVQKNEYIAKLDNSELSEKISTSSNDYEISSSEYTQTRLDTALTLRAARDEIVNLEFAYQKQTLIVEQSQFEPPATIQQNKIELEKAKRELNQAGENYKLKFQKAVAQMQAAFSKLSTDKSRFEFLKALLQQFLIKAPESGMLIYHKNWDGQKINKGSMINTWNPIVATLPDLSVMVSKTFVNEVDIRKIKLGQSVDIGLDAFPDKHLNGKVTSVSNVGEQIPNSDAKVFEVTVEIDGSDETLRPAMTTSNNILAEVLEDALYIPLESVHSQGDTLTYVFKSSGLSFKKVQVALGQSNENEITILDGLQEGDLVYLSTPADDNGPIVLLNTDNIKIGLND